MKIIRKHEMIALLNSSIFTDIYLTATAQLNLNVTESLVEVNILYFFEKFMDELYFLS